MIFIGEKLNGSIPAVAEAISKRDGDFIRRRARIQADAGADYLDVCASVEEGEPEVLRWMIDLVQEETDVPICIDSPNPETCVAAMAWCRRPGILNSVSLEGNKIDVVFPAIAGTSWQCIALLCDGHGIPDSVEKRMSVFTRVMECAAEHRIDPGRLHIDPLVVTLSTDQEALTTFAACCREIRALDKNVHITSGLSNISFGLPVRKSINQAFAILAMNAGMDCAILDPANRDLMGVIYAAEALLGNDEYCLSYIGAYRQGLIGPVQK